ncbi:MAG: bifunctional UDP-N-acetylglucosamine diphosphorylase/glucosamine-1-phosphate N-acetyltransferase GlmU, partial [bacterium]
FVTVNNDGKLTHTTKVGKKVYVGSNCTLVAPVKIKAGAHIRANSLVGPGEADKESRGPQRVKSGSRSKKSPASGRKRSE